MASGHCTLTILIELTALLSGRPFPRLRSATLLLARMPITESVVMDVSSTSQRDAPRDRNWMAGMFVTRRPQANEGRGSPPSAAVVVGVQQWMTRAS
jgi:hypothetical protein